MPLQFQDIWLPLSAGMDQSVDDRVAPLGKLLKADNVEFTKTGALQKRHGFRPIVATVDGSSSLSGVRGVFSSGRELCCIDDRYLYAYDDAANTWHQRGFVSPLVGKTDVLFRDSFDWRYVDLHTTVSTNTYMMAVGQRVEIVAGSGGESTAERQQVAVYHAADMGPVIEPMISPVNLYSPKVGRCYQKLLAIGSDGTDVTPGGAETLNVLEWNSTTPNTAPVAGTFNPAITNLGYDNLYRTFDLDVETSVYDYHLAYVVYGRGSYIVSRRNPDHTQDASATYTCPADHTVHTLAVYCDDGATPYVDFDGVDEYASNGSDQRTYHIDNATGTGRTIAFWVKTTDTNTCIFHSHQAGAAAWYGWGIRLDGGRPSLFMVNTNTTSHMEQRSDTTINDGEWHFVVATQYRVGTNDHRVAFYVDNVATSVTTVYNNLADLTIGVGGTAFIACSEAAGTPANFFDGQLTNMGVWGTELSSTEATELYNSGSRVTTYNTLSTWSDNVAWWKLGIGDAHPTLQDSTTPSTSYLPFPTIPDLGSGGNDGTCTNMESADVAAGSPGGSYSTRYCSFDGTNEYTTHGNVLDRDYNDPVTLSVWYRSTDSGYLVGKMDQAVPAHGYAIYLAGTGELRWYQFGDNTHRTWVETDATTYGDGSWYHVVVTSAGTGAAGVVIYVNGSPVATTASYDHLGTTSTSNTASFNINSTDDGIDPVAADIDEVAYWDSVISAGDVTAIYNSGSPADLTSYSPVGWWRMGEGSGVSDLTMYNMEAADIRSDTRGVYVLYSMRDSVNNWWEVWLACFSNTPALLWSRKLFTAAADAEADIDKPHTLGLTRGSGDRIICAWTARVYDTVTGENFDLVRSVGAPGDNVGTDSVVVPMANETMLTRPFHQDGRWYVVCESDHGRTSTGTIYGYPYCTNNIYELRNLGASEGDGESTESDRYYLAGTHDVGTASPPSVRAATANTGMGEGAANNVSDLGGNQFLYGNHFRSRTAADPAYASEGSPYGVNIRGFSAHKLTFYTQPQACAMQQGQAFISGGYASWYDGTKCAENSFPTPPMPAGAQSTLNTALGALTDATYQYVAIWEGIDDAGTVHRSGPSPMVDCEIDTGANPGHDTTLARWRTVNSTHRWWQDHILNLAVFRADADGVYQRCNPRYMCRNEDGATGRIAHYDYGNWEGEPIYTTGGVLESVAPEGFSCCALHNERVWTGGHFRRARIQYSKRVTPGTAAEMQFAPEFHESMGLSLPEGEDVMGLAPLDDKLVVFSDRAVYAIAGLGPDDAGQNSDFSQLTLITDKVGCDDHRSVVSFPGGVMFLGEGMIQMLTRSLEVRPIGESVRDWLDTYPYVYSADCLPERYEVLFLVSNGTSSCVLVYDFRLDQWLRWIPLNSSGTALNGVDACVHDGGYYIAEADAFYRYADDTGVYYDSTTRYVSMDVETGWIQTAKPGGWQRVNSALLNAEYIDAHQLTLYVYSDWHTSVSQSYTWNDAALAAMHEHATAKREQLKLRLVRQKCQAVKLRIKDFDDSSTTGEGPRLFGFGVRVGVKPGMARVSADQQA